MADRARARELAERAVADGRALEWFEQLYAESARGSATVPWADGVPNPLLCRWLDVHGEGRGKRALDVGCGLGDSAEELARRGFRVTAFDISATAVRLARERFVGSSVEYVTGDLLHPLAAWDGAFDLVSETYTLQVLPPPERARAVTALRTLVAPGGTLLVIARAREQSEDPGKMPWPLLRSEVAGIALGDLELSALEDVMDDEDPPVRRFVATFVRVAR